MTANYVPQVGDTVHLAGFTQRYLVTAVGERAMLVVPAGHTLEQRTDLERYWVKCELPPPPIADVWYYITAGGIVSSPFDSRRSALDCGPDTAIATLHTWTDADGVDHAEIERVTP